MKKIIVLSILCVLSLQASDGLESWFKEGSVYGNIRYYYIDTVKEGGAPDSSQHSNAIGGQLGYVTGSLYGLKMGTTFMTTNPFAIPNNPTSVDTSIIGRDNGVRNQNIDDADDGFSVLGEAYAQYNRDNYEFWYGRKVINTPLIDAKDVRMLPSAVQGGIGSVKLSDGIDVTAGYIDRFKQRTSDQFTNVIEHALGVNTQAITGSSSGYVVPVSLSWKNSAVSIRAYDYYASDFMNSIYMDAMYKDKLNSEYSYSAFVQGIVQEGIGNADSSAAQAIMGGKINTKAIGAKGALMRQETTLVAAYSHIASSSGDHDSMVLPWDGTPIYTNMITSNDLFVSNYGQGLTSDSAYIGGTTGLKFGVIQGFDFTGLKGVKIDLEYAHYDIGRFPKA